MSEDSPRPRRTTDRFERRRTMILDVASGQINLSGVRGMTLTAVAAELGLDTSSVTYYFRKKEDLAFACIERSLDRQNEAAREAAAQAGLSDRIRRFLRDHLDVSRAGRPPDAPVFAVLSDIHSMVGDRRAALNEKFIDTVRVVRSWFSGQSADDALIAAQTVLGVVNWLPGWIYTYADADFPRVEDRLFDIVAHGLRAGEPWRFAGARPIEDEASPMGRFLQAATDLINRDGYHGASVEKIAAHLGVSTGSFYHHLNNKDALVLACFGRHYSLIERASAIGDAAEGSSGQRLATTVSILVRLQFEGSSPLLRSSAFQALPPGLRAQMLSRTAQVTHHLAGVIADGIVDGSVRAVDALLAAHVVVSFINTADELRPNGFLQDHAAVERLSRVLADGVSY